MGNKDSVNVPLHYSHYIY